MSLKVCLFNKFGYCKFGPTCFKNHVETECEKDHCEIRSCPLRHPKICRYFRDQGYCKFGEFCRFKHFNENKIYIDKISEMVKEINKLASVIEQKEKEIENLKSEITPKMKKLKSANNLKKKKPLHTNFVKRQLNRLMSEHPSPPPLPPSLPQP